MSRHPEYWKKKYKKLKQAIGMIWQGLLYFLPEGHDNIHSARSAEKNVRVSLRPSAAN